MNETPHPAHPKTHKRLATFAARGSRKLTARQAELVEHRLPALAVPIAGDAVPSLDPGTLFSADAGPTRREAWLEIGFGGGEHLAGQAARNPDVGLIGCEPFIDGIAKVLTMIEAQGLANIRLHPGDARDVIDRLVPASIDRAFILFPDPWPKTRHHKRRLIQMGFLDDLSRVLRPGAPIRFATDVADYANWAMERFHAHPAFAWTARTAADWKTVPADHFETRYQAKALGDIAPVYFDFVHAPV
ncbi:MAG: tRNA (guanosine(46)-N7)-methyltransferase TrmB [Pseudomonadota bacterium]